jgi:hypothetical protein
MQGNIPKTSEEDLRQLLTMYFISNYYLVSKKKKLSSSLLLTKITKLSMDLKKLPIPSKDSMDSMNPFKPKKTEDLTFTLTLKSSKN